jgi:SAM-dependent methyltransferase
MKKKFRYLRLSYFLRKFYSFKFLKIFMDENFIRKKMFKYIFLSGYWSDYNIGQNHSRSGQGSNFNNTLYLQNELKIFFKKEKIKKILDIGCGDFNWMNNILSDLDYDSYLGVDIVDVLISDNLDKYKSKKINFINKDFINDDIDFLSEFDFVLVRDVFIHLKNSNINKAINKLRKINFRYIGITSDPTILVNTDLKTDGRYRDVNLTLRPFNINNTYHVIKGLNSEKIEKYNLNIYDTLLY